ncbi:MAG: DUF503 domain-containing protein [Candidatus Omnitrophota bacterium]|nr:MAG: DUF503 domain-containing protein [Candidatus Omnitrophota bacterium]
MVIGVLELDLFIPEANSLKTKRQALKGLKDKIRRKFNVSVAETDNLDKWQRQTLAVACINSDRRFLNSVLSKIVDLVETHRSVELLKHTIEMC